VLSTCPLKSILTLTAISHLSISIYLVNTAHSGRLLSYNQAAPPVGFVDPNLLIIGTTDHVLRYWPLDGGDVLGPTLTKVSAAEKLVCRYCGSDDLAPSFKKRRDARCRGCFKKRYGSATRDKKTARTRKTKAAK
jgi:hypothetical protein